MTGFKPAVTVVCFLIFAGFFGLPMHCNGAKPKSFADISPKNTVSVSHMADRYGFRATSIHGKQIIMLTRFDTLLLEGDSRKATFDGVNIWLNGPIARRWGSWHILQIDIDRTIWPLLNPNTALASETSQIVVIDPGHGGNDQGASSHSGIIEKNLTLELARKVRAILLQYRIDTRLTRNMDSQLELEERTGRARNWNCSVFVSIHLNAAANAGPSGIETHILPPAGCSSTANNSLGVYDQVAYPGNQHDRANMVLGYLLQKSLLKHTGSEDRGVRHSRFVVLKSVNAPAALIECGFISNRAEETKFSKSAYRDNVARGIAEGIMTYLNGVKRARQLNP